MHLTHAAKMPALVHNRPDQAPLAVFESASILLYLARTFDRAGHFHFTGADDDDLEQEMLDWCMWQMANLGPAQGNVRRLLSPGSRAPRTSSLT